MSLRVKAKVLIIIHDARDCPLVISLTPVLTISPPHSLSLSPFQPHWLPPCSSNFPGPFFPQDLCTAYSLSLRVIFFHISVTLLLVFLGLYANVTISVIHLPAHPFQAHCLLIPTPFCCVLFLCPFQYLTVCILLILSSSLENELHEDRDFCLWFIAAFPGSRRTPFT